MGNEATTVLADPRRVLTLIKKRVRSEAGSQLAPHMRSVLARSGAGRQLPLGDDADVRRFLARLGWLRSDRPTAANARKIDDLVADLAREGREDALAVGLYLHLFASGERLLGAEPVCGEMPRCQQCELADICHWRREKLAAPDPSAAEKPAERLVREGEEALTATELVALVLSGSGLKEARALAVARRLLEGRSLRDLAALPLGELAGVEGMSADLAVRLRAALALARRWSVERREPGRRFRTGRDFYEFFAPLLRDLKQECFQVVMLDQKNGYLGSPARWSTPGRSSARRSARPPRRWPSSTTTPPATPSPARTTSSSPPGSSMSPSWSACGCSTTWWWGTRGTSPLWRRGLYEQAREHEENVPRRLQLRLL
jgi:hypothetical protein